MTAPSFQQPTYTYKATVVNVVDGDTIDVHIDVGFNTYLFKRLRFLGVDTWEKQLDEYEKGIAAQQRLEELLTETDNKVFIQTEMDGTGKYGRVLAWVWTIRNGIAYKNINMTLLQEGHGTAM